MIEYKLLFTGTTGAGKTTAINVISDTPTISTEVENFDSAYDKETTTVGFDFGEVMLAEECMLRLYGTPGQDRFDFMWQILIEDALGLVILIDNSRPDPLADLTTYLEGFASELQAIPCVIGVGRQEQHQQPTLDDYCDHLEKFGHSLPVIPVDVREVEDVRLLLELLVAQIEAEASFAGC
ncbi:GTP-binding protein [Halioxenophilus sp. WMMB6]|uniref:GTP-binding protein n=1 Tax=Halioxenophilus sp. WMMB6 TaxID=3073815 RepID=UPI00295EBB4B|nr:ATP/GTP-binding protein [Halioxenophilus sp. WMMB6]